MLIVSSNLGNLIYNYRHKFEPPKTQRQLCKEIKAASGAMYHDSVISRIENDNMPQTPLETIVNIASVVDTIDYGNLINVEEIE